MFFQVLSGSLVRVFSPGFASPEPAASLQCWLLFAAFEIMSGQVQVAAPARGCLPRRRAAGSHCQAGRPGRPGPTLQIKAVACHCWVCDGSTARMSLTAPARPGSAAQLELGTPGCGQAAARAQQQPKLNFELQVAFWARAAVSI